MIRKWRLANFKSVYDRTELDLRPLTIFAGPNSSGKSTFIQSMLLVAQTLTNQVLNRPVILNGHIAKFGTYDDVASAGSKQDIAVGFTLEGSHDRRKRNRWAFRDSPESFSDEIGDSIACDFSFSARGDGGAQERLQLQPRLSHVKLVTKPDDDTQPLVVEVRRSHRSVEDRATELGLSPDVASADLAGLTFEVTHHSQELFNRAHFLFDQQRSDRVVGCTFSHFLPSSLVVAYDATTEAAEQTLRVLLSPELSRRQSLQRYRDKAPFQSPELLNRIRELLIEIGHSRGSAMASQRRLLLHSDSNALFEEIDELRRMASVSSMRTLLANYHDELLDLAKSGREEKLALKSVPIGFEVNAALQSFFGELFKYLGPLRDEPKAAYPLTGAQNPNDVGLKGEFTAAVLDLNQNRMIDYIPSMHFSDDAWSSLPVVRRTRLRDAVVDWLNYLGVVRLVETSELGVLGHEMKVAVGTGKSLHNLVHVGVGVSQVLPILVMSLLAPTGSTLVFEQPELHLHPKVQTLLGDFLLSMSLGGRQCIVETHSEYLINRLRYRAAVSSDAQISDMFNLYFVERRDEKSAYRKVEVNEYGAIEDWPEGFFDQSPRESEKILRAALLKRKSAKRNA